MRFRIAGIMTLSCLLSVPCLADDSSAWQAMVEIGLTGTWAQSCAGAATPDNGKLTYFRDANGQARRTYDRGPGAPSLNLAIDSGHTITPTTIQLHVRNDDANWGASNGTVVDVVIEIANNRMRTLESVSPDGTQWIKDGIVVKSGNPIPALEKCSN
jgi:hypothetical protein